MSSASTPAPPGAFIGRYRVISVLGEGATGLVYEAEVLTSAPAGEVSSSREALSLPPASVEPGQKVALKLLHERLSHDETLCRRFHREARILRRLRGRHLVSLLDFGEDPVLYMALELVRGPSLEKLLEDGPLDPDRAARIMKQIAEALDLAHSAGVIHRDLKPSNVIIEQAGSPGSGARLRYGQDRSGRSQAVDQCTHPAEHGVRNSRVHGP